MKIEDQLTNIILSKKLKELNVPQIAEFYWAHEGLNDFAWHDGFNNIHDSHPQPKKICSAFTASELGVYLPRMIILNDKSYFYQSYKDVDNNFHIVYSDYQACTCVHKYSENESNARAEMLIQLIENKIWVPNEN